MNFYTIRVNKLLDLDTRVPDAERIKPLFHVEKYLKTNVGVRTVSTESKRIVSGCSGNH